MDDFLVDAEMGIDHAERKCIGITGRVYDLSSFPSEQHFNAGNKITSTFCSLKVWPSRLALELPAQISPGYKLAVLKILQETMF